LAVQGTFDQSVTPSPSAGTGSPQGSKEPSTPGPGARMVAANANWGLGWRGEEQGGPLTVAAADAEPASPKVADLLGEINYDAERMSKTIGQWGGRGVARGPPLDPRGG